MIDQPIHQHLTELASLINHNIDLLVIKREAATQNKYVYRYMVKKLEIALGSVHRAQDKMGELR